MKINGALLPIKAHFFFFMAAMGPILPQLPVYGKQLGISTVVMGSVTGVLPVLFLIAKPIFGFVADRFRRHRKCIFITLVTLMGVFYALLYFVPSTENLNHTLPCGVVDYCNVDIIPSDRKCSTLICNARCEDLTVNNTFVAIPSETHFNGFCIMDNFTSPLCLSNVCTMNCKTRIEMDVECTMMAPKFWIFVILMCGGTIGFNVVNSISDAICFDVLGDGAQMFYGKQRVWGTIGFGLSALLSGFVVDWWSIGQTKSFTPALVIMLFFLSIDFICCRKLQLPVMEAPKNILKDILKLLRHQHIRIFILFAGLAGIVDSFIIYFFFWYLEDVALATGHMHNIKLLEGIIVAAETLGGEVIFFSISGIILERIGFGHTLSMCFIMYALRLGLISIIPSPWWAVPIELCLQGPTYALCYTTIVAYASAVSPPGTSATMQGLVAGIDDGFGYAIGSVLGGLLYRLVGGKQALQIFSAIALFCGIVHFILYKTVLESKIPAVNDKSAEYQLPPETTTDENE